MKNYKGLRFLRSLILCYKKNKKTHLLPHRVFQLGNPSKYVPRETGLNFLDQARPSAVLNPR